MTRHKTIPSYLIEWCELGSTSYERSGLLIACNYSWCNDVWPLKS